MQTSNSESRLPVRLPIVRLGGRQFFVDARLKELRDTETMDTITFEELIDLSSSLEDLP